MKSKLPQNLNSRQQFPSGTLPQSKAQKTQPAAIPNQLNPKHSLIQSKVQVTQINNKALDSNNIQEHTINAINQILSSKSFELFQPVSQQQSNHQVQNVWREAQNQADLKIQTFPIQLQEQRGREQKQVLQVEEIKNQREKSSGMQSFNSELEGGGYEAHQIVGLVSPSRNNVLKFYKTLLAQHQESQKLSLITLQITKILNLVLSRPLGSGSSANSSFSKQMQDNSLNQDVSTHESILGEMFNLVNLLIYPQKIFLTQNLNDSSAQVNGQLSQYDSSQAKVRDVILYLKVMKQIINLPQTQHQQNYAAQRDQENAQMNEDCLFTLSDVIDDSCLNQLALIRHLMFVWERIVGTHLSKVDSLTLQDLTQLRVDLAPLMSKHIHSVEKQDAFKLPRNHEIQNAHNSQSKSVPNLGTHQIDQSRNQMPVAFQLQQQQLFLEQSYYEKLHFLESKLKAYKQEYVKAKALCKQQDKLIVKYEQAITQLSHKKSSLQKQQQMKNQIFDSFLQSLKSDYQQELEKIRATGSLLSQSEKRSGLRFKGSEDQDGGRSRSISPINLTERSQPSLKINFSLFEPAPQQSFMNVSNSNQPTKSQTRNQQQSNYQPETPRQAELQSRGAQTEEDERDKQIIELEKELEEAQRNEKTLAFEKRELLKDKHSFNDQLSALQEEIHLLQEKLDKKNRKYQVVKKAVEEFKEQGERNKEAGLERVKEELEVALKQKTEAEKRTKKFETQFRAGLKEINDLREQIDQLQSEKAAKDQELEALQMPIPSNAAGGSDSQSSSFILFNNPGAQQQNAADLLLISELEREKEMLLQKIALLEKSNLELLSFKRQIEATIKEISKEPDDQKKLQLVSLNLVRRKSLLRLENAALFGEGSSARSNGNPQHRSLTPDRLTRSTSTLVDGSRSTQQYRGQKQQIYQQYTPGNRMGQMTAPDSLSSNQIQLLNQQQLLSRDIPSPQNYNTHGAEVKQPDLGEILDQIQRLDDEDAGLDGGLGQAETPKNRSQINIRQNSSYGLIDQQQERLSNRTQSNKNLSDSLNLSQNEKVAQNLFNPVSAAYGNDEAVYTNRATATFRDSFSAHTQPQNQSFQEQQLLNSQRVQGQDQAARAYVQLQETEKWEDEEEEEEDKEAEEQKGNFLMMQLKKQMSRKLEEQKTQRSQARKSARSMLPKVQKSIIKEAEHEDEYDDEEDSSSDEEEDDDQ